MIGRTASHYRILSEISRGGMGIVYRAVDVKLNREVALKFLPPELTTDLERKRRFVQEAQAAAALKHPNIAVIYEIDDSDGVTFIAMELIDGGKLGDLLTRGPLSPSRAVELAMEVAEGLSRAHEKGVVHRDLKPANIMVTVDGHPKIIDFGLAKLIEPLGERGSELETAAKEKTEAGRVMGTFAYMSPEQALGRKVDHRSDIFSFGVVLYEMLTGELPSTLGASMTGAISRELQRILDRCLATDPDDRYQTARDLFLDLRRVQTDRSRPRYGSRAALGVAFSIALVFAGLFLTFRTKTPDTTLPRILRTVQITHEPGLEVDPALSPDGKMVAYAKGPIGQTQIYVQQVAGGRPISLTEGFSGPAFRPRWSPDGTRIAFLTFLESRCVYVVPALGGAPRRIVEGAFDVAWAREGRDILYSSTGGIFRRAFEGGAPDRIVDIDSDDWLTALSWSSDGNHLAYVSKADNYLLNEALIANLAPSSILTVPARGGEPMVLTEGAYLHHSPVWTPDGEHILFVSNRGGNRDIYQISVASPGEPPERLTTGLNAHTISLSRDGKSLAYSVLTTKQNIWSHPIPENGPVSVREATPVTTGNQAIEGINVSPDGQWLVFDSNRSGNQDIYKIPLGGGEPLQLTTDPADDFIPAFSPDGKEIAFYSFRTGNRDIFVMSSEGGTEHQLTRSPASDQYPIWSPEGQKISFQSDRSGRMEVYVISADLAELEGGTPLPLTSQGGMYAKWSPDGTSIAYAHQGVSVVDVKSGESRALVRLEDELVKPAWSADGQTIYYLSFDRENGASIGSIPATGGEPKLLVRFDDPNRVALRREWAVGDGGSFSRSPSTRATSGSWSSSRRTRNATAAVAQSGV
jgi:Tol biopolymer transport system component/tRNA A-37 threonylcarbamoyl transferase component Bud32